MGNRASGGDRSGVIKVLAFGNKHSDPLKNPSAINDLWGTSSSDVGDSRFFSNPHLAEPGVKSAFIPSP